MSISSTAARSVIILSLSFFAIALQCNAQTNTQFNNPAHRIQLAILLDTSNSMDGLIDQTRSQIWSMVDELSKAKKNGQGAKLEVAVLEYGNQGLSANNGHIRTVTGLTSDLDLVSEALFSLHTNGGDEYCGYAIQTATNNLQWSQSSEDLKLIYIAGNEPFTQGPIFYEDAIKQAKQKGIIVSTIFAGNHNEGVTTGWQGGALLAGGNFMNVDHNRAVVHIAAPQDQRIVELNTQLNKTYVPYGSKGKEAKTRQEAQDTLNAGVSIAMMAQRTKSKASSVYKNSSWDMVDAMEEDDFDLESIPEEDLPTAIAKMDNQEKQNWLLKKKNDRKKIKQEIHNLTKERDTYVASEKMKLAESEAATVDDVLASSIKEQAKKLNYSFE